MSHDYLFRSEYSRCVMKSILDLEPGGAGLRLSSDTVILGSQLILTFSQLWKWNLLSCANLLFAPPWPIQSMNSLGHNIGMGSLSLLQRIFPTQGSKPGLPHCGQILYQLSHKGSPRVLKWVAYPWSSWPRNRTGVSCIAGGFFATELSWKL